MWFIHRPGKAVAGVAALAAMLLAAGCGFRPLYGEQTAGGGDSLANIRIELIADRSGQMLRNMLLDRLTPMGPPSKPDYALAVTLQETKRELAIRKDDSATRANLTVTANFVLRAVHDPRRGSFAGTAASTNSYNVLQSDYATLSAENDARRRALRVLSEEIRLRVAAALQNPRVFKGSARRPPG